MAKPNHKRKKKSKIKKFFLRGLGILLPTVLTLWILVTGYNFVEVKIAHPINKGIRHAIVLLTPWPEPLATDYETAEETFKKKHPDRYSTWVNFEGKKPDTIQSLAQHAALERHWNYVGVGSFAILNLLGFLVAFSVIYTVGVLLGSFIGRNLYRRGEELITQIPFVKQVYPHVKQVTDFLFAGGSPDEKMKFSRVVAVEYPRKGLWSVGLVTGDTMRNIQAIAGDACVSVFIPSSPTPFTGYVISLPEKETVDLDISIDEALKFTISGGVIIPPSQAIEPTSIESQKAGVLSSKLQSISPQDDSV